MHRSNAADRPTHAGRNRNQVTRRRTLLYNNSVSSAAIASPSFLFQRMSRRQYPNNCPPAIPARIVAVHGHCLPWPPGAAIGNPAAGRKQINRIATLVSPIEITTTEAATDTIAYVV